MRRWWRQHIGHRIRAALGCHKHARPRHSLVSHLANRHRVELGLRTLGSRPDRVRRLREGRVESMRNTTRLSTRAAGLGRWLRPKRLQLSLLVAAAAAVITAGAVLAQSRNGNPPGDSPAVVANPLNRPDLYGKLSPAQPRHSTCKMLRCGRPMQSIPSQPTPRRTTLPIVRLQLRRLPVEHIGPPVQGH